MIYVIGNSHIRMFYSNSKFTTVEGNISTAAATAHNLNRKNSTSQSNRILFDLVKRINKKTDSIILVYGEVDCRLHIYYQFKKNNEKYSISELICKTVNNYGEVLKQLADIKVKFYVCGIPPAGHDRWALDVKPYPYIEYAPPEVLSNIFKEFNQKLGDFCKENGYTYFDIYSKTVDENGFMKEEYAEDSVHLNSKALPFITEMMNRSDKRWWID